VEYIDTHREAFAGCADLPAKDGVRDGDLVNRAFMSTAPNELWVAEFTYVRTWAGSCYVAFIIDVFSRMIVGPKVDTSMRADLVTDTLEMAVWARERAGVKDLAGVIHHTDAGSQYISLALTERLAALGMRASIGTVGDEYHNALAEQAIGLYKTELIRRRGPWRTLDDVEIATLEWVDWSGSRRLHTELGDVPPAKREAGFSRQQLVATLVAAREPKLHSTRGGSRLAGLPRRAAYWGRHACPLVPASSRVALASATAD